MCNDDLLVSTVLINEASVNECHPDREARGSSLFFFLFLFLFSFFSFFFLSARSDWFYSFYVVSITNNWSVSTASLRPSRKVLAIEITRVSFSICLESSRSVETERVYYWM